MDVLVINLDRCPERWSEFQRVNAHLHNVTRFPGSDGSAASSGDLIRRGLFTDPIFYNPGAIGNTLSHIAVWEQAAKSSTYTTVIEDDAIIHKDFEKLAPRAIEELPEDWDIVLWGWNFDAVMGFDILPGVPCATRFSQTELRKHWQNIQNAAIRPDIHRLHYAFGAVSHSVSPKGAEKLRRMLLPIRPFYSKIPALDLEVQNDAIDSAMCSIFHQINAFVCFPPLVITRNEHSASTVMHAEPEKDEESLLLQPSDLTSSRKYKRKYARYLLKKGNLAEGVSWYLKYLTAGRNR